MIRSHKSFDSNYYGQKDKQCLHWKQKIEQHESSQKQGGGLWCSERVKFKRFYVNKNVDIKFSAHDTFLE